MGTAGDGYSESTSGEQSGEAEVIDLFKARWERRPRLALEVATRTRQRQAAEDSQGDQAATLRRLAQEFGLSDRLDKEISK